MTHAEIISRVQKLLALANDKAASEGEIANALALAHRLMQKHRIEEVELDAASKDSGFEIIDESFAFMGNKYSDWKAFLAHIIARHNGCYVWLDSKHIKVAGRPEDAQVARAMYKFVAHQIMALAKMHSGQGAKFLRAWRPGVVFTIDKRLKTVTEEFTKSTALVVVNQRSNEVEEFVKEKLDLGARRRSSTRYDDSGFSQGLADGHKVRLHNELEGGE